MSSYIRLFEGPESGEKAPHAEAPVWVRLLAIFGALYALDQIVASLWISVLVSGAWAFVMILGSGLVASAGWTVCAVGLWKLKPFGRRFFLAAAWSAAILQIAHNVNLFKRDAAVWEYGLVLFWGLAPSIALIACLGRTQVQRLFPIAPGEGRGRLAGPIAAGVAATLVAIIVTPAGLATTLLFRHDRTFEDYFSHPPVSVRGINLYATLQTIVLPGKLTIPLFFLVSPQSDRKDFVTPPPPPPSERSYGAVPKEFEIFQGVPGGELLLGGPGSTSGIPSLPTRKNRWDFKIVKWRTTEGIQAKVRARLIPRLEEDSLVMPGHKIITVELRVTYSPHKPPSALHPHDIILVGDGGSEYSIMGLGRLSAKDYLLEREGKPGGEPPSVVWVSGKGDTVTFYLSEGSPSGLAGIEIRASEGAATVPFAFEVPRGQTGEDLRFFGERFLRLADWPMEPL